MSFLEFFAEGGVAMFPVFIFALASIGAAARYAWRPDDRYIAVLRALSAATAFGSAAAVASCISAVMHHVPANPEWSKSPEIHLIVMVGIGESMAPAILGLGLLALAWVIAAFGLRRAAA
jgi:hypothetical protein